MTAREVPLGSEHSASAEHVAAADPTGGHRLHELDAMRGLAAFSVVLMHFWIRWNPETLPGWALSLSVLLRPMYAGNEAVVMFFVLSGLVLALPYVRGKEQPYPVYLLRRVLRIYGPYLAALALGVAGAAFWHARGIRIAWDMNFWSEPVSARLVLQHLLFVGRYEWTQYDFVLWTLVQEMRVSIVFPLLVAVVLKLRGAVAILVAVGLSVAAYFLMPVESSLYVRTSLALTVHVASIFIVGILLAAHLQRIRVWWGRTPRGLRVLFGFVALLLYGYGDGLKYSIAEHVFRLQTTMGTGFIFDDVTTTIGTVGLIVVALHSRAAKVLLHLAPVRFLGRVSYSLYLVHPLVLLALTLACGNRVPMALQFGMYLICALGLAWMFCGVVEERFIALSRRVGMR